MGSTTLYQPSISLARSSIQTPVGTTIDPLEGVTATNSVKASVGRAMITYAITDQAGNTVTAESASTTEGVYKITYAYRDAYRGTVTATAIWTVGNPVVETTETTVATETSESISETSETTTTPETSASEQQTQPAESAV